MVCPNCKTSNDDSALFCRECGTKLSAPKKKEKKSSRLFLTVIIALIVVGGVIAIIVNSNNDSSYSAPVSYEPAVEAPEVMAPEAPAVEAPEAEQAPAAEEPSLDELYARAETVNDLEGLAWKGYLPAAYDLVHIFYNDGRYEECSRYAYQCIDANYRTDEVWDVLRELPAAYWRREYSE